MFRQLESVYVDMLQDLALRSVLSQYHNFYFIASDDIIQVYVLTTTHIPPRPVLILQPDLANPAARGRFTDVTQHTINHMIIGELGTEEVLVFATESGNVGAFHVSSIASVLEEVRVEPPPRYDPLEAGRKVRCFFTKWIGASAWGLATHKQARLIAVSANNRKVSVFALGLHCLSCHGRSSTRRERVPCEPEPQGWIQIHSDEALREHHKRLPCDRRSTNVHLIYHGHGNNIPSVSFDESGDDPTDIFMLSVDIENVIIIWRVWKSVTPWRVLKTHLLSVPRMGYSGVHRGSRRGWGVLALNRQHFRTKTMVDIACPGASDKRTWRSGPNSPARMNAAEARRGHCTVDVDELLGRAPSRLSETSQRRMAQLWAKPLDLEDSPRSPEGRDEIATPAGASPADTADSAGSDIERSARYLTSMKTVDHHHTPRCQLRLPRDALGHYCPSFMRLPRMNASPATVEWHREVVPPWRDFAFAHFGQEDVMLYSSTLTLLPSTIYRNPFVESEEDELSNYDEGGWRRINMFAEIAELGVIVAASQHGRVAVFTMTDVEGKGPTLRIDHLIPRAGEVRERVPLAGLAVGPVLDGMETGAETEVPGRRRFSRQGRNQLRAYRRYRLILYFQDHTIMHYELSDAWPGDMLSATHKVSPNEGLWTVVRDENEGQRRVKVRRPAISSASLR
ncbi:hypothetical protein KEM52_004199 [Ascosphaera acerosa]|nr:hypothetical protein KEM52_004199 [Ascosphaera acerosa]